jgi:hypothetical protein
VERIDTADAACTSVVGAVMARRSSLGALGGDINEDTIFVKDAGEMLGWPM